MLTTTAVVSIFRIRLGNVPTQTLVRIGERTPNSSHSKKELSSLNACEVYRIMIFRFCGYSTEILWNGIFNGACALCCAGDTESVAQVGNVNNIGFTIPHPKIELQIVIIELP